MTSSDSLPENEVVPDRSIGYTKIGETHEWHPNTDTLPPRPTSAGGGYSTVEDLLRFANERTLTINTVAVGGNVELLS